MKIQHIFFATICIVRPILPSDHHQNFSAYQVTLNIHADSTSSNDQKNSMDQSLQQPEISSHIKPKATLQPNEDAAPYIVRNSLKLIVWGAVLAHPTTPIALPIVYFANRIIVQPLLGNGSFVDSISQEEQERLAQKGKIGVPDMVLFPCLNRLKHKIFDK